MERMFDRQGHRRRQNPSQQRMTDRNDHRRNSDEFRQDSPRSYRFGRDMDQDRYDRNDYRFRDDYEDSLFLADQDFESDSNDYEHDWSRGRRNEGRSMSSNQYGSQSSNWNRSNQGDRGFSDRGFPERSFPSNRGSGADRSFSSDFGSSSRSFAGRGPKGYQRSDERIREDICECLAADDSVDASAIEVKVSNCEVTLSGTVEERRMKRMAEDLVERVSGVKDVHNEIRVQSGSSMMSSDSSHMSANMSGSEKPTKESRDSKSSQTSVTH